MARITLENVDEKLKTEFKIYCLKNQTTMRKQILEWIEQAIQGKKK